LTIAIGLLADEDRVTPPNTRSRKTPTPVAALTSGALSSVAASISISPVSRPAYGRRTRTQCTSSPTCRGPLEIEIEVKHGVVILNGRVPNLAAKCLAGVPAWWVPGSRDVVNGLVVEPPEEDAPLPSRRRLHRA
jgi:hypothetical protein